MEFNEETAFSRFASLVVFLLVIPTIVFYIGIQFQKTVDLLENYSDLVYTFEYVSTAKDQTGKIPTSTREENQVFCTMDAKLCPDGSYVGRQGPNCEFAPCPNSEEK